MKIFIGNLGNGISRMDLIELFAQNGHVVAACAAKDDNGQRLGFGYVRMKTAHEGLQAIKALNKKRFKEQYISVSESIHSESYSERVA